MQNGLEILWQFFLLTFPFLKPQCGLFQSYIFVLIYENDYSKIYIAIIFVNTKKTGLSWK